MTILSKNAIYAKHLVQHSMDYIGAADETGRIIEYNPAALKAFGYTMDELKNLEFHALYASIEEFERVSKIMVETGQFSGEVRNKRKNGEEFICYLSANVIRNENGEVIGSMGVSRDISREKELARKLEIQNEKNAQLIDELVSLSRIATHVNNGVLITDPEGRMKWANESFSRITGYTQKEMIGFRPSELFKIPHFFQETFDKMMEEQPRLHKSFQVPHYRKNGDLYWMMIDSTPVYNESGELHEIIEICTEITAQKKAELALIESEANFRQMSETIEDLFFLYNVLDREYEYISPNCFKMFGVNPEFFYEGGEFLNAFVHPEDRHKIRRGRLDILNGLSYDVEYRVMVGNNEKWIQERAYPIYDEDDQIIKGSGIISDITQTKRDRAIIDHQNKNIAESISYAKHIQESTLQDEEDIKLIFKDSFLYFLPKTELSGDFYIIENILTNDGVKMPAFIIADCTGHGVPGAILSILCLSLVRQSLSNRDVNSPAESLNLIRSQLAKLFDAGENLKIKDGMDVGFGVVNKETKQIHYSGANLTAHLLRGNEWFELRGTKQHVGYSEFPEPFVNVIFDYQAGDQLYLFTDGFVDQFGGTNNKKYMKRKLMDFVETIAHEPMNVQQERIAEEFKSWKGREEQTDDVCCFGFRLD